MHPRTGAIATFEQEADAEEAGYTEPLDPRERELLMLMPRAARADVLERIRAQHGTPVKPNRKKRRSAKAKKRRAERHARRKNRG